MREHNIGSSKQFREKAGPLGERVGQKGGLVRISPQFLDVGGWSASPPPPPTIGGRRSSQRYAPPDE